MKKYLLIMGISILCMVGCVAKDAQEKMSDSVLDLQDSTEAQEDPLTGANNQEEEKQSEQESEVDDALMEKDHSNEDESTKEQENIEIINPEGMTILDRFDVPNGFTRNTVSDDSFGAYLRGLPLKEHGSKVMYYDGRIKNRSEVYEAVVDMDIGKKNLQQCADAVMRLRGEYFYQQGAYDKIHFNFTNGFRVDYSKWMDGYRVSIEGNKTSYVKRKAASNTYEDFRRYMELIFAYAGTLSLEQELESIDFKDMEIGDVLIQGGSPGHAVIVVDMASNEDGKTLYMLAQSYMPAQDTQVLCNPNDDTSPWYTIDESERIVTPEWTFTRDDLKRFTED